MNIEQFKVGVSRIRNPVIAKTLGQLELIEEWGSGYKRIKDACEAGGYPLPTWEEFGSALRVTFFPHPEVEQISSAGIKSGPSWGQVGIKFNLEADTLQLLSYCLEPKTITELMEYLGWKIRTKFRQKYVTPLIDKGLLEMTVPDKPQSSKQKYKVSSKALDLK